MKFAQCTLSEGHNPDHVSRDIGACLDIAATVGLRHCDIRLNNVLLFNGVWQLCDWGLCALPGEKKVLVFKKGEQGKCAGTRIRAILDNAKGDRVSVDWIYGDDKEMLHVVVSTCKSHHAYVPLPHALSVLNLRNERAITYILVEENSPAKKKVAQGSKKEEKSATMRLEFGDVLALLKQAMAEEALLRKEERAQEALLRKEERAQEASLRKEERAEDARWKIVEVVGTALLTGAAFATVAAYMRRRR
jgi:hypothetical protein